MNSMIKNEFELKRKVVEVHLKNGNICSIPFIEIDQDNKCAIFLKSDIFEKYVEIRKFENLNLDIPDEIIEDEKNQFSIKLSEIIKINTFIQSKLF